MDDKEAYRQSAEAKLKEWNARMDLLKAKAEQADAEARIEYSRRIQELEIKGSEVRDMLDRMKTGSGNAWRDLKSGVEEAIVDLKRAVDRAYAQFK